MPSEPSPPNAPPPESSSPDSDSARRTTSLTLTGRLHPATLVLALWQATRNFLIPAVGLFLFGGKTAAAVGVLLGLVITLGVALVRYFTFSYGLEQGELVTRQGLLGRQERNIPLERVQDIHIEQGLLHRLFGVVEVHVETAGGAGPEASLSVLSRAEAERLRRAVFERMPSKPAVAPDAASTRPTPIGGETIRQVALRELVLAGLTSNHIATALVIVGALWGFVDDILPEDFYERTARAVYDSAQDLLQQGAQTTVAVILLGGALVFLVGALSSVIGTILLFHGFTLSRRGEDLHRSYGLLTHRSSSLPRRRVQVLEIEEGLLRRLAHLATLRADTAGSPAGEPGRRGGGRDVLLPIVPRGDVEALLPTVFPDLEPGPIRWRRVSRRAIARGTLKGVMICAAAAGATLWYHQALIGLWPLGLLPLVYLVNVMRYKNLGYQLGEPYFYTRRGWLSRSTHIVPIRNIQTIVLRQTPFDRRLDLATLIVDTAGQAYTGGGPRISHVPLDEARRLAATLAHQASRMSYRW